MSENLCLIDTAFSITGASVFINDSCHFEVATNNAEDEASILAYQWYLNGKLIVENNQKIFHETLAFGMHRIGARILTSQGWSGIKYVSFQNFGYLESITISGPTIVFEGDQSVAYSAEATFSDGAKLNISNQAHFTLVANTRGGFTGNKLNVYTNDSVSDTVTTKIQASYLEVMTEFTVTITDKTTAIEVNNFDFMTVRYKWESGSGSDLDILVGYENNGTQYDNIYVGYGQSNDTVPASTMPKSEAYLWWALDNAQSSGYEGVLIGIKKFVSTNPNLPNVVEVGLYAVWYGEPLSGNFSVELVTYLGGTMSLSGNNFVNTGGTQVSSNLVNANTSVGKTGTSPTSYYKVGVIKYNKTTQSATMQFFNEVDV